MVFAENTKTSQKEIRRALCLKYMKKSLVIRIGS